MLALFINSGRGEAKKILSKEKDFLLISKAEVSIFNKENFSQNTISEAIEAESLFATPLVFFFDGVLGDLNQKEIESFLKDALNSRNMIVFLEKEEGDFEELFKKAKAFVFKNKAKEEKESFFGNKDIFKLSDALFVRDKKQSWLILQKLLEETTALEVVFNMLWALRSIEIARNNDLTESKLSPFIYSKAKKASSLYSEKETGEILKDLVSIANIGTWDDDALYKIERLILVSI